MRTVNVHEAKTHLSQLLVDVENGEEITIARAGKPVARLSKPRSLPPGETFASRIGMFEGQFSIPEDFNTLYQKEIEEMFYGGDL